MQGAKDTITRKYLQCSLKLSVSYTCVWFLHFSGRAHVGFESLTSNTQHMDSSMSAFHRKVLYISIYGLRMALQGAEYTMMCSWDVSYCGWVINRTDLKTEHYEIKTCSAIGISKQLCKFWVWPWVWSLAGWIWTWLAWFSVYRITNIPLLECTQDLAQFLPWKKCSLLFRCSTNRHLNHSSGEACVSLLHACLAALSHRNTWQSFCASSKSEFRLISTAVLDCSLTPCSCATDASL